jgi:multicomponent Na+:H+ antiporter subunit D
VSSLLPLTVAVPLIGAPLLAVGGLWLPRRAADVIGLLVAAATTALCAILLAHVGTGGLELHWFGGWHPRGNVAVGVDFAADAFGLGLAAFVGALTTLAFLYTTASIESDQEHYHPLMLVFLAAMVGFCESGDLFNLFVFFELMSVSGFALVGYLSERGAAIEGALNFGVTNTIGSFLFLAGIGLIYGRTGALNLAQIGEALAHRPADGLVLVAFGLLVVGFAIKAGIVPFQFWLADAYAVAPAAVCLLLAGAMSEMGLFGVGRVYFSAFQHAFAPHAATIRAILVGLGLLTALWGGALALVEDHLKRMLAFVTISAVGVFLCGVGLLDGEGAAGTGLYVLADGCAKAGLFSCVGILQHRHGLVGERALHGRGRAMPWTAAAFFALALALATLPPFGPFLAKSTIDGAAVHEGYGFVLPIFALSVALGAGAILRAGARVFLGWGRREDPIQHPSDESSEPHARTPAPMAIPVAVLLLGVVALGVWFGLSDVAARAGERFSDQVAYTGAVLHGAPAALAPAASRAPEWFDWLCATGGVLGALLVAAIGLWGRPVLARLIRPVQGLHTGRVGDYTAWLALGAGGITALMLLAR